MQEVFEKIIEKLEERTSFLSDCTKYGNKDAKQQNKSYSTMMMYEVADLVDDLIEIVKQAAAEYNSCWIPCSERFPSTNESVLCWAKSTARGGDVCFVGSCHNGFWFLQSSADTHSFPGQYVIVAWHPLPEPYKPRICAETKCTCNDGKDCKAAQRCTEYQPKGE